MVAEKAVMEKLEVLVRMLAETEELSWLSDDEGCETPKRGVFDPFAPAAEDLALFAPRKQAVKVAKVPLRRRLDFDACVDDDDDDDEERHAESLRMSILEFVVSAQVAEMAGRGFDTEVKTPTSVGLLTGIAETCPDAPRRVRPVGRRNTDGICRKLEFGL